MKTKGTLSNKNELAMLGKNIENRQNTIDALKKKSYGLSKDSSGTYILDQKKSSEQLEDENTIKALEEQNGQDKEKIEKIKQDQALLTKNFKTTAKLQGWGMAASAAGTALGAWANNVDINKQRELKSGLTIGSSALSGLGTGLMVGAIASGPIGALVGILSALPGVIQGIGMFTESTTERL